MDYKSKANEARKKILTMVYEAQTSHIASNFSVIDIACVLYDNLKNDEVVWSKGWAAATIYYFLAQQGKIPKEDLDKFSKEENGQIKYLGLAETTVNGVLCNSGSMGHGLPVACGIAYAKKLKGEKGKVYCIMSDGEMNCGTTWESAMFASHHNLNNLVVLIDKNKWQAMGRTKDILDVNLEKAWKGFGWHTHKIDGHNHEEIKKILLHTCKNGLCLAQPMVVICDTVKGKGVSFMENHLLYHYKNICKSEYEKAMAELEGNVASL